jgi:tetratricopeptide (TPR) repeat protein
MFLDQVLAGDDPKRSVVHTHFGANLRDMVEAGVNSGAQVLLCTVAVNLTDCPPFASLHGESLTLRDLEAWTNHVDKAIETQAAGQWNEALNHFGQAAALDPDFALLRYRQGLTALALTNTPLAREQLQAACDVDALPFRTDSELNAVTRAVAQEYADRGVSLVDTEQLLNATAPAGHNLFLDHVHFDLPGNELMGRLLAAQVVEHLPESLQSEAAAGFESTETVARRLALTDWNRVAILENMLQRLQEPPFSGQINYRSRNEWLAGRIATLRDGLHPRYYLDAEDLYLEAIQRDADDPFLHKNFAAFLEATDDLNRAVETWQRVSELLPEDPLPWFEQGRLLVRLGELERAHEALDRCLEIRSDLDEARLEIGQLLFRQRKHAEALVVYEDLRRRNPGNARVLRHMADPLGALERRREVIDCLTEAVRLKPGYWEARYLLGVELGLKGDFRSAQEQFAKVVSQRPDFILARVNLGVSYVRSGKLREARQQFVETLRLEPQNATARQHLDNLDELLRQMSEPKATTP